MGVSGSELNTSRKSTLNRRQQQQNQHQTNGIKSYAYGTKSSGQYEKEHQSLDILSLLNLSKVSQEQKSACPSGDGLGFLLEVASPKKGISTAPDNHRKSFNEMLSKPHKSRTAVEQLPESLVHQFLGDDGMDDYKEGSSVQEAHVACSVEDSTSYSKHQPSENDLQVKISNGARGISTAPDNHRKSSNETLSKPHNSRTIVEQVVTYHERGKDLEVNASNEKYNIARDPQTIPSKIVVPPNSVEFTRARDGLGFLLEVASPKKGISTAPDNHRKSFNDVRSKPPNSRKAVEQLLGKVGMETPVHAPKQAGRTFSYGCSSPLHGAKKANSFKNQNLLDDIEIEVDAVMRDVKMPLSSSGLELSEDVVDSFGNAKKKFSTFRDHKQHDGHNMPLSSSGLEFYEGAMNVVDSFGNAKKKFSTSRDYEQHDGHSSKFESHYEGRRMYNDIENSMRDRGDGRSSFLEESSNKREHELSLKNWPTEVNRRSADSLMHGDYTMSDFSFEEQFSPKRFASNTRDKYTILDSTSYSKHQPSENDLHVNISNGARYHTVGRIFDLECVPGQPDSCFATEYDKDNLSLLSEESCSSNAVGVNDSMPESKLNKRTDGNSYPDPEYQHHIDIALTKRTQDINVDIFQPKSTAHGSWRYTYSSFLEKTIPKNNWWSLEQFVDTNSGSSSFHHGLETKCPVAGSKPLSRDPSSAFDSQPVASSHSGSFISDIFPFHDSPMTFKFGIGPTKAENCPYLDGQTHGTTAYASIAPATIEVACDKRQTWLINEGWGLTFVSNDDHWKYYHIDEALIATAVGVSDMCLKFANLARDVSRRVFRGISAPESVYLVARVLKALIDNWESTNRGQKCQVGFLLAGYYNDVPLVLTVNSESEGGILCGTRIGYEVAIGSGETYASSFAGYYRNNLEPFALVSSAIVAAALFDQSTGGEVNRASLRIGGESCFWSPSFSILEYLERGWELYSGLLKHSLFFRCDSYPYDTYYEQVLFNALHVRFPGSIKNTHVISRKQGIRIITFFSANEYHRVLSQLQYLFSWEIRPLQYLFSLEIRPFGFIDLLFYMPTQENIRVLRELEQS